MRPILLLRIQGVISTLGVQRQSERKQQAGLSLVINFKSLKALICSLAIFRTLAGTGGLSGKEEAFVKRSIVFFHSVVVVPSACLESE